MITYETVGKHVFKPPRSAAKVLSIRFQIEPMLWTDL